MLRCMSHSNSNSSAPRSAADGIISIRTVATATRTVATATRTVATNGALVKRVCANPGDASAEVHSGSEKRVVRTGAEPRFGSSGSWWAATVTQHVVVVIAGATILDKNGGASS
jgi:hypothetical protein